MNNFNDFPNAGAIKLAKVNEWWEIEDDTDNIPKSSKEFYKIWEEKTKEYAGLGSVICVVPTLGNFAFYEGEIYKVYPPVYDENGHLHNGRVRNINPATVDTLKELEWNIHHGCANLEVNFNPMTGKDKEIILYGTGKPFQKEL